MVLRRALVVLLALSCLIAGGCATTGDAVRGTWTAVSFSPEPLVPGTTITIIFDGSSVTGSGGCNGYGSRDASIRDGRLIAGQMASTAMACMDTRVMEQEDRFYTLLNSRPQVVVDGDTLVLSGTTTLTFRRT